MISTFKEVTIGYVLRKTVASYPGHEALIYPELKIKKTYAELLCRCKEIAKGFMALGVKKGDHVSVWATNVPEWVYLQFGLGMIGAVLVTVNTSYKAGELEYILNQSDSTTLVLIEGFRDNNYYNTIREVVPRLESSNPGAIKSPNLPYLKNIIYIGDRPEHPGMYSYNEVVSLGTSVSAERLHVREKSLNPHDVINMQYTSGTTGFPKGVMLTHYNIVNNALLVGDILGLTKQDKMLIQVPLFHCFGCVMSTLNCVCHGSTMVLLEYFNPLKALQIINQELCTVINGVPTMFIAMLNHPNFEQYPITSLRTGIMAGAPCPVEVMNEVSTKLHCPEMTIAYGLTESSPAVTMTRREDPIELRVSTVGQLLPNIEGKIVNPASGKELPSNTPGEIVTRSACVMKGYYKMPEATTQSIDEKGWLHTGDLGTVDENGYFRVTGRIKDLIIRGGENISPREIEEFLYQHPKVNAIQVIGVPDKKYGEQILAIIQLKDKTTATVKELLEFCIGKIARYKIPKYWEFVTEYPLTASGKVQKYKLREMFAKKYA